MVMKKVKESKVGFELIYAYAKIDWLMDIKGWIF